MTKQTDEERREVAARLRVLAGAYENTPAWSMIACGELPAPIDDAMHACGLGRITRATEICARLADLIEPKTERTCRKLPPLNSGDRYTLTAKYASGLEYSETLAYARCSECGTHFCDDFAYCPKCGAKVEVDE